MIQKRELLNYMTKAIGKPILVIYNHVEGKEYNYLLDNFKPSNPSNHIYDNSVTGKNIDALIKSITAFAGGLNQSDTLAILTKIETIELENFVFPKEFLWIKVF